MLHSSLKFLSTNYFQINAKSTTETCYYGYFREVVCYNGKSSFKEIFFFNSKNFIPKKKTMDGDHLNSKANQGGGHHKKEIIIIINNKYKNKYKKILLMRA